MLDTRGITSLHGKNIFFVGLLIAASGIVSPPIALALGILFGFTVEHPFPSESSSLAKLLLQLSVIALGFGMNLKQVVHAGRSGFIYTAVSISLAIALGLLLGKLLGIGGKASFLITAGTAICGGSAIAAIAPITDASEEEISVSMGTVFLLNSVALLIFPAIGYALHLSQNQFGLWTALAIHDTSSVVGAAAKYGAVALAIATTVKLARALWIVPLSIATAVVRGAKAKIQWPWFIGLFCLAAVCNTYLPAGVHAYSVAVKVAKIGLTATLFLIGSGISVATLKQVGPRPLLQGILLWLLVSVGSLWLIRLGWIAL